MKIYFDTEFTGLHRNTSLISIGMVAETGETFYAEFTDYDQSQVNTWIQQNVIDNLLGPDEAIVGTKLEVGEALVEWLEQFDEIEWVSDVCHYDFVLLIDLLAGHALNMPSNWNPACHDINQDIARFLYISELEAFDYSREMLLMDYGLEVDGNKHNALYDAKVIKELYSICN